MNVHGVNISKEIINKACDAAFLNGYATTEDLEDQLRKLGVQEVNEHILNIPFCAASRIMARMKSKCEIKLIHCWVKS